MEPLISAHLAKMKPTEIRTVLVNQDIILKTLIVYKTNALKIVNFVMKIESAKNVKSIVIMTLILGAKNVCLDFIKNGLLKDKYVLLVIILVLLVRMMLNIVCHVVIMKLESYYQAYVDVKLDIVIEVKLYVVNVLIIVKNVVIRMVKLFVYNAKD